MNLDACFCVAILIPLAFALEKVAAFVLLFYWFYNQYLTIKHQGLEKLVF